jgi:type I restriction enzyme R subunit
MPKFDEKVLEDYVVEKLQENGWIFKQAKELERSSHSEPLLVNNLVRKLSDLNKNVGIGDEEIRHVLNELKLKGSGIEGAKSILTFLKLGVPIKFEKDRVVRYVKLIDFTDIERNEFIVSRQVPFRGGDDIRTDVMLYVNGIPLVEIELKNPVSFSENWFDAYRQIKDYERAVPELYKYVQLGVAAEHAAKYFPVVPWQDDVGIHEWREGSENSIDSTIEMLSRARLLDIIQNYLFFRIERGEATKVVARYMQYRAAEGIVARVLKNIKGETEKAKGLVWHWQGSGKTLTMIFAANKLHNAIELENPSIFFIVDRTELESQLFQEFTSLDIARPHVIESIERLRGVLRHDEGKGRRGMMITLIHKFRPEELTELQKDLEEISKDRESILNRRNVVAFVDEGHRTQYGSLAAQMKSILREAFFFAFTGTPISKRGRDTYLEFSYPPEEKYLDRYFVTDSIEDGFTVKIAYQPRLREEVHLKKDMLKTFLDVEFEELPEEIDTGVEERVRRKLNRINLILENPRRVKMVAEDIVRHFEENVEGKFKAMVVAGSRKACVHYKRALDEYLPEEYSEVVMTYTRRDPEVIRKYRRELRERFGGKDTDEIRKETVDSFREEEMPRILIVTDMLLTGFDAPILQTMYLDKLLKEHRLLQAIARTNRPFKELKEAGMIVDYVGILSEFRRAFEVYSKEEINGALFDLEDLREDFERSVVELVSIFGDVPRDEYDQRTLLTAIEILTANEETGRKFLEDYKKLRKMFELLGSDVAKIKHFSNYKWLSAIYTYYVRMVLRVQPSLDGLIRKYFDKTVRFVHNTTELKNLERDLPVLEFDERYLKKLEETVKTREERAANIVFTLNRFVLVEKHRNPVFESITDKVERILELWKQKTKDFERIYEEGVKVISEIEDLSKRQKKLGYSDLEYSSLLVLEERFGKDETLDKDVKELSEILSKHLFPAWEYQPTARKGVEREIRRFVRRYVRRHGIKLDEIEEIFQDLMRNVGNYGKAS